MWNPMAWHILHAGHTLYVWNRTKSKTDNLVSEGAIYCDSIAEVAGNADIIFTIIGDPKNVEDTYFGEQWIIENAKEGSILVDMTTTKPSLAGDIYKVASKKGIATLDAPVSGGDVGAKNATLSIMVGGEEDVYEKMLPIFDLLGASVSLMGNAWAGQSTKMANQVAIAGNMVALCESLLYAEKSGLDLEKCIEVFKAWGANNWGMQNLSGRILDKEFDTYFFVKHFVKDMRIALDECRKMNLVLPGLSLVHDLYSQMLTFDEGDLWLQALIVSLKRMNNM